MAVEFFEEVYELINVLRQKGVKMKDIAGHVNLQPSVLSALYSTVLPTFGNKQKELGDEEALNYALSQVNNISRKRLLKSIPQIHESLKLFSLDKKTVSGETFIQSLENFTQKTDEAACSYLGLYDSYSISSARDTLKIEPFILTNGENKSIKVMRKSAYNLVNTGVAIIANGQNLYIMLNESDESQLALVTIYLHLPFYQNAQLLRGIYMALDYNRNPIARRILFVKKSDSPNEESFNSLEGKIVEKTDLAAELSMYYDYVSGISDTIKMYSVPFPKFNQEDLVTEKKVLSSFNQLH
ncbi:hypothetical protein ACDQ55_16560 [Chitinophaga sp. 30R24]|uniref:hypothetical protein n=1 Tax=Chitinophaga sp. 30R24 TaxID=3248838 RepID=UPI003B8EE74C